MMSVSLGRVGDGDFPYINPSRLYTSIFSTSL